MDENNNVDNTSDLESLEPQEQSESTTITPETETAAEISPAEDAEPEESMAGSEGNESDVTPIRSPQEEAIYTIRLLTAVAVGSVVEGADQLVTRLKRYEEEMRQAQAAAGENEQVVIDEDEIDRLRYATIGLIFDTQNMIGRSLKLAYKAAETGVSVTEKIAGPFWNFFLFRPVTKRVDKRVDNMTERGQDSLSRWIKIGREVEPESRQLATFTYEEIVDEFIERLADNEEVQELIAQQSISMAAGVRDEVRERTVTSDNVLEDIARKILRREPRPELPEPPPEVQRWAGISLDDAKELEREQLDEQQFDTTE